MEKTFICLASYRETIKLFHFQTLSFAHHKASDELVSKIDDLSDTLFESWQGLENSRISLGRSTQLILKGQQKKNDIHAYSRNTIEYLLSIDNPELATIRDELVTAINKFIYLLSF